MTDFTILPDTDAEAIGFLAAVLTDAFEQKKTALEELRTTRGFLESAKAETVRLSEELRSAEELLNGDAGRHALEARLNEALSEIEALKAAIANPEPQRYHGCYNLGRRAHPIRDAAEVVLILGGYKHLSETLGDISDASIGGWAKKNYVSKRYEERIRSLMAERGYTVDHRLFR